MDPLVLLGRGFVDSMAFTSSAVVDDWNQGQDGLGADRYRRAVQLKQR